MNKTIYSAILVAGMCLASSCSDEVTRPDEWPEWPAKAVVKVNGLELTDTYYTTFNGTKLSLTQGQTVDFAGIDKLQYTLQSHFWDVTSAGQAVFKGATGNYDVIYDHLNGLLYLEQPEAEYPEALYVIGEQLGHSGATEAISTFWSIDAPDNVQSCRRVAPDKFEISLYLAQGFKFKFFRHHGWGSHEEIEIWAEDLTINQPTLVTGTGDFCAGPLFQAGVYDITVDLTAKTFDIESRVPVQQEDYYVNGVLMEPSGAFLHTRQTLTKGQEVVFGNFGGIADMVQPQFFKVISDVEGRAEFIGPTGEYDLYFDAGGMLIYAECPSMNEYDGTAMWVTGSGFGHPKAGRATVGAWKLTEAAGSFQMVKVAEGVYETSMYLARDFDVKFYRARDWGSARSTQLFEPVPADLLAKGVAGTPDYCMFTGDLLPGPDFTAGSYTVRVDFNNKIVYLTEMTPQDKIKPVDYKVNGVSLKAGRYAEFLEATVSLTKGERVSFENFQCIDYMLQPEYFVRNDDGSYTFNAMSGEYRVLYDVDGTEHIWTERTSDDGLWITGQYFGHGRTGGWDVGYHDNSIYISKGWSWDNPRQYLCCAETAPGVYETTFLVHSSWSQLTLYGNRGWDKRIMSSEVTITDTSSFGRSFAWQDGVGNDANFGCTVGDIGQEYGTYRLVIDTNQSPIVVTPVLLDGHGHH